VVKSKRERVQDRHVEYARREIKGATIIPNPDIWVPFTKTEERITEARALRAEGRDEEAAELEVAVSSAIREYADHNPNVERGRKTVRAAAEGGSSRSRDFHERNQGIRSMAARFGSHMSLASKAARVHSKLVDKPEPWLHRDDKDNPVVPSADAIRKIIRR
jgi:hypothetical protein